MFLFHLKSCRLPTHHTLATSPMPGKVAPILLSLLLNTFAYVLCLEVDSKWTRSRVLARSRLESWFLKKETRSRVLTKSRPEGRFCSRRPGARVLAKSRLESWS